MMLSAHQPAYLPWLGYFDKIAKADIFVYLDTVQYEKNSFINRNKIKTPQGDMWLTIPVKTKGHTNASLRTTEIDESRPWRNKHLRSIEMCYRKVGDFDRRFSRIESLIHLPDSNLSDYCFKQLRFWLRELSIDTKVIRASDLETAGTKSDLILDLCRNLGATQYISGALGRNYLNVDDFSDAGIAVEYQNFMPDCYPQLWGEFHPYLSVLDWWMNSVPAGKMEGVL